MADRKYEEMSVLSKDKGSLNKEGAVRTYNGALQEEGQKESLTDGYLKQANEYLDAYKNSKFKYDLYSDPVYQQARDAYIKQGQQSAKNTAAQAATLTGGYGNSYGTAAAQQQYNAALSQLNDIVPQLENNAYGRYQNEQNKNMNLAQMYFDLDNQKYNRDLNEAQLGAQYGDYSGLNNRGIDTSYFEGRQQAEDEHTDWQRDREKTLADQADEDRNYNRTWNEALQKAAYGDYSGLQALGIDTSTQEKKDQIEMAIQWAEYGDYSLLEQLGVDISYIKKRQQSDDAYTDWQRNREMELADQADEDRTYNRTWNEALQRAAYGDYSGLQALGIDTSTQKKKEQIEMAIQWAEYGDYRLLEQLGIDISYIKALQKAQLASLNNTGGSLGSSSGTKSSSKSSVSRSGNSSGSDSNTVQSNTTSVKTAEKTTDIEQICNKTGLTPVGATATGYVAVDSNGNYYDIKINRNKGLDEDGGINIIKRATK